MGVNDYNSGFGASQALSSEAQLRREYADLKAHYNNLLKHFRDERNERNGIAAARAITREIALELAAGKGKLLTPPVDRGLQSRLNYTVLKRMGEKQPEQHKWLLSLLNDDVGRKEYGLE